MDIYLFNEDGVYLRKDKADPNPLEPSKYLYPKNSTPIKPPPATAPDVAVWVGSSWSVIEDLRGTTYWIGYEEFVHQELGPLPAEAVLEFPGVEPIPEGQRLAEERKNMNPPKSAFMEASVMVSSFEASHANLLETFDITSAALGPRNKLERWDRSVSVVERLNPDMTLVRSTFRMSEEKLDALCRLAIAYSEDPLGDFTSEIDAFEAIPWEAPQ
jgi:hypothetical protein